MNFLDGYIDAGKHIRGKEARHEFYGALIDYYVGDGEVPEFEHEVAEVAFWGAKYSLDKARAGRAGGKAKKQTRERNANETPSKPEAEAQANPEANANETPSKTRTDCERNANETPTKEKEKEGKEELPNGSSKKAAHRAAFRPPSVEEVVAYATEANLALDANRFCDYYASKGWLVGKARMKDWKAAARNWAARDRGGVKPNAELGEYAQPF